jgi:ATP-dependent exoDNAse (exonuclease V) beta subunit
MSDLRALDAAARERALDPTRSILLEAPAGSGKTTVLTQRILRLLACVDEPEEVLAITFTRKAAAEMRERVLEALRDTAPADATHRGRTRALAAAARAHGARRHWDLEHNPARLRIQTIDSLNHSIASRLPIAARAGGALRVHDRAGRLHRLAARRTLEDGESLVERQPDLGLLFDRLDNDWSRFERLLAEMLARRAHWLPLLLRGEDASLRQSVEDALGQVVTDALQRATACIPRVLRAAPAGFAPLHARRQARAAAQLLAAGNAWPSELAADASALPFWQCLATLALTREGRWRQRLNATDGFPPDCASERAAALEWIATLARLPGALPALAAITALPPTRLEESDAAALVALSRTLRFAAAQLEVIFQEQGQVDHPYVAAAARRALTEDGAPTDLALRLGAGIRHVLIDEFQDTSGEQFELVRALTAGWEEGDGRTLFAVGDPMQSIYQFREAEVGLFLRARDHGIGSLRLEALRLTRNFRSLAGIVAWNNATFGQIFPDADEGRTGAVAYSPSVAADSPSPSAAAGAAVDAAHTEGAAGDASSAGRSQAVVALHRLPAAAADAEANAVTSLIADLRRRDPRASIAILVAARRHATPITAALLAAGIPVTGVDLVPLEELPAVRDLAALTRALDHPADRGAWLAILRAPWCGLTLRELALLIDRNGAGTVWEALHRDERLVLLSAAARHRVERFCAVLEQAFAAQGRMPLASLVESTWLALGGPSACAAAEELANAEAYLQALAQRAAQGDWNGPQELDELLEALYAAGSGAPADAVQIMTMHRAKGLEFDCVILPGLGRRPRPSQEPLLRWLDLPRARDGSDLLLAPSQAAASRTPEPINLFLKRLQKQRADHERVRLLYVAATRARRELHLFAESGRADPDRAPAGSLLGALWPALGREFSTAPLVDTPIAHAPPTARVIRRLAPGWAPPPVPTGPPFAGLRVAGYEPAADVEIDWAGETARHVGTAVHAALERLGRLPSLPTVDALDAELPRLRAELAALGVEGQELGSATRRAGAALRATLGDPRGRWILDPGHPGIASELGLTGLVDGRLVSVIIDRSFIDESGTRWVVDFKTSAPRGADLESFLDGELELYRPQLEKYVALARGLGHQPVRAALYFPVLSAFRECPIG